MFIEIGDKNCVLDPTTQRYPTREHHGEQNQHLLNFIRAHNLIEPIVESHPDQPIYTRESKSGRSKAKLDHVLVNAAAYSAVAESGWIQQNPTIPSDHGMIWISIPKEKLNIPKMNKQAKRDKHHTTRLKGAHETTHDKYAGHPVRLILPDTQAKQTPITHDNVTPHSKLTQHHIASLLIQNGYHGSLFTHHTKNHTAIEDTVQNLLMDNMSDLTPNNEDSYETISRSIKWRNDKKEWWIHAKHAWVAHHMINKGKAPYAHQIVDGVEISEEHHSQVAPDPTIWRIRTKGKTLNPKTLKAHLRTRFSIPIDHVADCILIANNYNTTHGCPTDTLVTHTRSRPEAGRRHPVATVATTTGTTRLTHTMPTLPTPLESTPLRGAGRMRIDQRPLSQNDTYQVWQVKFQSEPLRNFWPSIMKPWLSDCLKQNPLKNTSPYFRYATGWSSYSERIEESMENASNEEMLSEQEKEILNRYTRADQLAPSTLGHMNHTSTSLLWNIVKKLMQNSASKSFGHYTNGKPSKATTLTATIFKWTTTLSRLVHLSTQNTKPWESELVPYIKSHTQHIPITAIQPDNISQHEWTDCTKGILKTLKTAYVTLRGKEIKENQKHTTRKLDAWFIYDVDKYLNHTIRIPKTHQGGLDWPTDANGEIPLDPSTRIQHHKSTWEQKTNTRKPIPEVSKKPWLGQLMKTTTTFTEQMSHDLTAKITEDELQAAYKRIKSQSAPGPSGIRNAQWKNSPEGLQVIILDLYNIIYDTGDIPADMKNGTIYPIPKDTSKACTSDNARPLTMLETGLKILTQILSTRITNILSKNPIYNPIQYAFLPGKTILDPLRLIEHAQADARTHRKEIHQTFLDLTQAFDRLEFWAGDLALKRMQYPEKFNNLVNNLNIDSNRRIVTKDGVTTPWKLQCGIAQGEVLSPIRFITVMDMLATWLTLRANGHNPTNKRMGYQTNTGPTSHDKKRRDPMITSQRQKKHQYIAENSPLTISSILYCDDISITTNNFEDMQDLIGVISEFMTTFGIQINNRKSFYTMKSSKPSYYQDKITKSPITEGEWVGGIDGTWKPIAPHENHHTHNGLTIKQHNEPIRYLGVHYTLNGDWKYQHNILKNTLQSCLLQIRRKSLPQNQLAYLINCVILPKLSYPLQVINTLSGANGRQLTIELDKMITKFVKLYFGLPQTTNHSYLYTKTKLLGFGLNSLEDEVNINIITNTTISLNEHSTYLYWQEKQHQPQPTTTTATTTETTPSTPPDEQHNTTYPLYDTYLQQSDLYTRILRLTLNPQNLFALHGYQKGNKNKDDLPGNLAYRYTSLGYTVIPHNDVPHDTNTNILDQQGTHLIRTLTKQTYDKISHKLKRHNTFCMNDFTTPSGTHLLSWSEYDKWENPNRNKNTPTHNKPNWFTALESETLLNSSLQATILQSQRTSSPRVLKPQFIDCPRDIDFQQPFCYTQHDVLHICQPTHQSRDALKVKVSTLTYDGTTWHNRNYDPKEELILLHSRKFSSQKGALIPLEGILTETQIQQHQTTVDANTYNTLKLQCKHNSRLFTICTALQSNTSGSMLTDTITSDDLTTMNEESTNDKTITTKYANNNPKITKAKMADSYSDGSVYHLTAKNNLSAFVATKLDSGANLEDEYRPVIARQNHPQHPTWTSPTAVMNYNPEVTTSTEVELLGLQLGLKWFTTEESTLHSHAIDNQPAIHMTSTESTPRHIRHMQRENSHYTLTEVRSTLKQLGFYNKKHHNAQNQNTTLTIQWIKGHTGNRLHECADRNAARMAFRRTSIRGQNPNTPIPSHTETKLYPLYFYECLVQNDIRKHVKTVCKNIHKKRWSAKPSQGRIARLIDEQDYNGAVTSTLDLHYANQQRFFALLLNSISHTPHQEHKIQQRDTPACALCTETDADIEHIIHHCPHPDLVRIRRQLNDATLDILNPLRNLATIRSIPTHNNTTHTIHNIPNQTLYPHSIDLHDTTQQYTIRIIEALPESRWYRKSHTRPNTVTVEDPYAHRCQEENLKTPNHRHYRVNIESFWNLISWHELTHDTPLPLKDYDKRAHDIWTAAKNAKHMSGHPSLCWAAPRALLDILIDEIGCSRELFSNILNTYNRFESRCMLQSNPAFSKKAGIRINGLSIRSFIGNVYGNPPYDGKSTSNDTVKKTLDKAEQMCRSSETPFTGTFIVPLTPAALRTRLANPHTKLLFKFPNNTLPFIPDAHWHGKSRQKLGCYNQLNTNIVILLYQTPHNIQNFHSKQTPRPDIDSIQRKLAHWFLCATPQPSRLNVDILRTTGVPLDLFVEAWASPYPSEWKFWEPKPPSSQLDTQHNAYAGATQDLFNLNSSKPFSDIINWDRRAAALGIFPRTFPLFLKATTASLATPNQLSKTLSRNMRAYTAKLFKKYWQLDKMCPPEGTNYETALNLPQVSSGTPRPENRQTSKEKGGTDSDSQQQIPHLCYSPQDSNTESDLQGPL